MLRQFGHFEKCGHVFFVFGFPLEDIKRAVATCACVRFAQIKLKQQAVGHIGFEEDPSVSCCYICTPRSCL